MNQIGMKPMIDDLQRKMVAPLSRLLFPVEGERFTGHHSFMVQYKKGEDLGLDMHHDDSDVTLNVCLGREFTGATLSFCGGFGHADHRKHIHTYHHQVCRCRPLQQHTGVRWKEARSGHPLRTIAWAQLAPAIGAAVAR